MKIVVFAGGVGTRLWPLSRQSTPKQFEKIIGEKSTLQLAVDRLLPGFKAEDIYISTGSKYESIVREQLPFIAAENFIFEPEMRDVGPAVGLAMATLSKNYPDVPVAILWSDHFVKKERRFREVLRLAEYLVGKNHNQLVLIGQRARFANQNLGWIELGKQAKQIKGTKIFHFKRLIYRPKLSEAESFLQSGKFVWNPGYFVTTPGFLLAQFKKFTPKLWHDLAQIQKATKTEYKTVLRRIYPGFEKLSFDNAILEKVNQASILVVAADLGWSDVGAWEALKEALEVSSTENVTKGKVLINDSSDNLIFNYTDQLTVGIDLQKMIVINTDDVLLICHKNSVPKIKKLVENLAKTSHKHLT